jgi:hypothetical protein
LPIVSAPLLCLWQERQAIRKLTRYNIDEGDARQALLLTRRVLLELFNPAGLTDA